ncbi:mitochondrial outer membrane protein porin of 34 kDa-like protein [Tanacetum coccineum]
MPRFNGVVKYKDQLYAGYTDMCRQFYYVDQLMVPCRRSEIQQQRRTRCVVARRSVGHGMPAGNLESDIAISQGVKINHRILANESTITVGTRHLLVPLTTMKARVINNGKASALIQHEWRPKSLFTFSGEVDTKAIDKSAKFGLAPSVKSLNTDICQ